MKRLIVPFLLLGLAVYGCSSDKKSSTDGPVDKAGGTSDTNKVADTNTPATDGPGADTSPAADKAPADTGTPDTGTTDAGATDASHDAAGTDATIDLAVSLDLLADT